jgi:hypothetical protein
MSDMLFPGSGIIIYRVASVSTDLPREAVEQGVGACERVFGLGIIVLVHFQSSFAQGRFNSHAESGELRMQDMAVFLKTRINGIGGTEIGGCADGRQVEMMPGFALRGSFLTRETQGHQASDPKVFHYFLTTSPTTGFAEPL